MTTLEERTRHAVPPSSRPGRRGPHPLVILAAAFVLGLLAARVIDWRSHAHPRE